MKFHRLDQVLGLEKCLSALIILNGPCLDPKLLSLLWPLSRHPVKYPIICADGGANLLYDATHPEPNQGNNISLRLEYVPKYIVGDLDSLRNDVREFYVARGCEVVREDSLNSNDFQKAMRLADKVRTDEEYPIVVIGGWNGRIDQTLGNLNTLLQAAESRKYVYWMNMTNVVMALAKGKHHISIDASREGPTCGLIPVGGPVDSVRTEGLRWNLDEQRLAFGKGGLISTSNEVMEPVVLVETSAPVLWTAQLRLEG